MSQQTEDICSRLKDVVSIVLDLIRVLGLPGIFTAGVYLVKWIREVEVVCLPNWGIWLAECVATALFVALVIFSIRKIRRLRVLRRSFWKYWKDYAAFLIFSLASVFCLIVLVLLTVGWVIPRCRLQQFKATHPFWVTVADFYSAGEEDTLSGGLRSDLYTILVAERGLPPWLSDGKRSDLHAIPAPLPRAWVGRVCKTFKEEEKVHDRADQCGQNSGAAILVYGWLRMIRPAEESVGMEAWFAIDEERLPLRALDAEPEIALYTDTLQTQVNLGLSLPMSFADVMTYTPDVQFQSTTPRAQAALVLDTFRECVTLLGAGLAYHMEGEQEKAIGLFEVATQPEQGCPNLAMILVLEGNAKAESGDLGGAAMAFENAIEVNPRLAPAYVNLSIVYLATGRVEEAANALEQLVQLQPGDAQAYYNLGYAYFALEQWHAAGDAWETALQLNPDYVAASRNLDFLESFIDYQAALPPEGWATQDVLVPFVFRNLGTWYLDAHMSERAVKYYQFALDNTSEYTPERLSSQIRFEMGLAYGQQGRSEQWEHEWELIGWKPEYIFRLSEDKQAWFRGILGPDVFDELKQEYAPPPEIQPEPPDLMPPEIWFEPLWPVIVFP